MVKYNIIKSVVQKLLNDEVYYSLDKAGLQEKVKAWQLLQGLKIDGDMLYNNFLELKKLGFFDTDDEEDEYKSLEHDLQIFYYVIFKKYTAV